MIFAAIIGLLLGLSGLQTPVALLIFTAALGAKIVIDIRWDRVPFFGGTSPYVVYCRNLSRAGEPVDHAWISYGLQLLFFGAVLGVGAFALVRYFR